MIILVITAATKAIHITAFFLINAVVRAVNAYNGDKEKWAELVDRAMKCDNSWGKSAKEYIRLYKSIIK